MNPRRNIQSKRQRARRSVARVREWLRTTAADIGADIIKCTACKQHSRPTCYWCHGVGKMLCE